MKKKFIQRLIALTLTGALAAAGLTACSGGGNGGDAESGDDGGASDADSNEGGEEAGGDSASDAAGGTFIADRTVVVQVYVDDIGYKMPDNLSDTLVMQELKERTGIDLVIQYTPGDDDAAVLASQLASGTIPDVIVSYLDDSTRPEFSILLKAAQEEMFADVSEYIGDTEVYSKYLEDGYLKNDTYNNIFMREDFGGSIYLLSLSVDREDRSTEWVAEDEYLGGMYIQSKIVEDLGIDPTGIRTQDEFYDLLVSIKEGGYTDANGNDVYPLGPKFWLGSVDALPYVVRNYDWYKEYDGYNMTADGEILHEVETEYAMEKVRFIRKLLEEDLINPEFFTMDGTRAEEVSRTGNSAIIADVHNYQDIIFETNDWVPLGPLNDFTGNNAQIVNGKSTHGVWAISENAENPEEILKFFDYIATPEGQLLTNYGIEGVNYTMEDGKPVLTEETLTKLNDGDEDYLVSEVGASFGNTGFELWTFMHTDIDYINDFGESRPGASLSDVFANAITIAENYEREKRIVSGLKATAYLNSEELSDIKVQMDLLNYPETLVQAMYAGSEEEAQKILDSFLAQLESAGLARFKEYLADIYQEDPEAICFDW